MLIHCTFIRPPQTATLRRLLPVVAELRRLGPEERAAYRLPEAPHPLALNAVHFRNVERIYGDQGAQVVDLLKRNPSVAAPVVVPRLEQKDAEWRRALEEMSLGWKDTFKQNYYKSLDHRSFYFKQQDKKTLSSKSMLQEIKDASDRQMYASDESLASLSASCAFEAKLHPHLEFEFDREPVSRGVTTLERFTETKAFVPRLCLHSHLAS